MFTTFLADLYRLQLSSVLCLVAIRLRLASRKYGHSICYFTKFVDDHPTCVACAEFANGSLNDRIGLSHGDLKFMNILGGLILRCEDGD